MVHYATVPQNIVRYTLQVNPIYADRHGVAFTRPIFMKHGHPTRSPAFRVDPSCRISIK